MVLFSMRRGLMLSLMVVGLMALTACQPRAHRMVSYQPIDGYGARSCEGDRIPPWLIRQLIRQGITEICGVVFDVVLDRYLRTSARSSFYRR